MQKKAKQSKDHMTSQQVVAAFGVQLLTIENWRAKRVKKYTRMPATVKRKGKVHKVSFSRRSLKAWAKKNGVKAKL